LFTNNGNPIGTVRKSPRGANDLHVAWAGGQGGWIEIVIFTTNGKISGVLWPPPGANDIDIAWSRYGTFDGGFWTRDGEPIAPIPIPPKCNDAHFKIIPLPGGVGPTIVRAWWTRNGKMLKPIPVPRNANDFHLW
jgi:hypothetical protein